MALLPTQTFPSEGDADGAPLTYAVVAAGGDTVASPGKRKFLVIRNDDVASTIVTIVDPRTSFNGGAMPDTTVTVAAGTERVIPIPAEYTDPATGEAAFSCSNQTSVTAAYVSVA